jgi:hypothetical protein
MSEYHTLSKKPAQDISEPIAALYSPDLMFLVRLQGLARAAGYRPVAVRNGGDLAGASVLVVNLSGFGDWPSLIAAAVKAQLPVIAFGPHMDAEGRQRAKAAGATRVIANSNLDRSLPQILLELAERAHAEC